MHPKRTVILLMLPLIAFALVQSRDYWRIYTAVTEDRASTVINEKTLDIANRITTFRGERLVARYHGEPGPSPDKLLTDVTALERDIRASAQPSLRQWWARWINAFESAVLIEQPVDEFFAYTALIDDLGLLAQANFDEVSVQHELHQPLILLQEFSTASALRIMNYAGQLRALSVSPQLERPFFARFRALQSEFGHVEHYTSLLAREGIDVTEITDLLNQLRAESSELDRVRTDALVQALPAAQRFERATPIVRTAEIYRSLLTRMTSEQRESDFAQATSIFLLQLALTTLLAGLLIFTVRHTARLRREQADSANRLSMAAQAVGFGTWMGNLETREVLWSDELRQLLGLSDDDSATTLLELVHDSDFDDAEKSLASVRSGTRKSDSMEVRMRVNDTYRWFSVTAVHTTNAALQTVVVGIVRDIQSFVDARGELASTRKDLDQRNTELQQFARSTAHDLREPIRMVNAFADLLSSEPNQLTEDSQKYLSYLLEGSRRANETLNGLQELLSLTRMGHLQSVDLEQSLSRARETLQLQIQETGASVTTEKLPAVMGHQSAMDSLLLNLLSNALKYTDPDTAPRVEVSCETNEQICHLQVRDHGIGIDPQDQRQVFEPFKRLHTRKDYAGSGLGLSLCKRTVDLAGGEIWLESEPNKGTTVHVRLALAKPELQATG